jgi:hypothetical protein
MFQLFSRVFQNAFLGVKILDFSVECIKNEKLWNVQASFVKAFSVPLHSMLFQN